MRKVRLAEVAQILMGQAPIGESYNQDGKGLPLIAGAADLGKVFPICKKFTTAPSKISQKGDIIMCIRATIGDLNWSDGEYALGRGVAGIRPSKNIDSTFLWFWLFSKEKYFVGLGKGATFLQINKNDLGDAELILPPLAEQQHIARVLDQADQLRQQDRQLMAHYDALVQAVFAELFGDQNPATAIWPEKTIAELAQATKNSMRTGPFGSDLLHSEFVEEGTFVLGIDNVVNNRFEWAKPRFITGEKYEKLKRYTVYPGDVLISIMGTIGRTAVVPDDIPAAINSKHLAAITLNRNLALPTFVSYSLHADPRVVRQLSARSKGAIMDGLNLGIIKDTKLLLPPLPLQQKFAAIVAQIEQQKAAVHQQQAHSEALFQSLLQQAFRGELGKS